MYYHGLTVDLFMDLYIMLVENNYHVNILKINTLVYILD